MNRLNAMRIENGREVYQPEYNGMKQISGVVEVPGSKSMTNRALLLAALSEGDALLHGVLFSDDSRHFLSSLLELGFDMDINEEQKTVRIQGTGGAIPKKAAQLMWEVPERLVF